MTLVFLVSFAMTSYATAPYIEIVSPNDGSEVGKTALLKVVAEGRYPENPVLSIEGENTGVGYPLTGCTYSKKEGTNTTKLQCEKKIDLSGFLNQRVDLKVVAQDKGKTLKDSVGLFVSGNYGE